jgi:hypothetical protein
MSITWGVILYISIPVAVSISISSFLINILISYL